MPDLPTGTVTFRFTAIARQSSHGKAGPLTPPSQVDEATGAACHDRAQLRMQSVAGTGRKIGGADA
jgi:hypothetical protein